MPDLMDTIQGAVDAANDGMESDGVDTSSDSGSADSGIGESSEGTATTESTDVSVSQDTKDDSKTPAAVDAPVLDDLDKELEAQGIKSKANERENRIPYNRVKKIVETARKKLADQHTETLKERDTRLTRAEQRAQEADRADALARTDPQRYMDILAAINPKFKEFRAAQVAEVAKPAAPKPEDTPPPPDYKFEDGSLGYTAEGHQKLMNWYAEKGKREALTEVDKRFGPIEERWKSEQIIAQQMPKVNEQISRARATWGPLFEADYKLANEGKSEILAFMKAHPEVPFDAACTSVLLPKTQAALQADRDKMRAELLAETSKKVAAASKSVPSSRKSDDEGSGPRTIEDVIKESMAAAGLR